MTADAPDLDYPMRVIREQAAALREAEAKLAAIQGHFDHVVCSGHHLNGKGEPT